MKQFAFFLILFSFLLSNFVSGFDGTEPNERNDEHSLIKRINRDYYKPIVGHSEPETTPCYISIENIISIESIKNGVFDGLKSHLQDGGFIKESDKSVGTLVKKIFGSVQNNFFERVAFLYGVNNYYRVNYDPDYEEVVKKAFLNFKNNLTFDIENDEHLSIHETLSHLFEFEVIASDNESKKNQTTYNEFSNGSQSYSPNKFEKCDSRIYKRENYVKNILVPEIDDVIKSESGICVIKWGYRNIYEKPIFIPNQIYHMNDDEEFGHYMENWLNIANHYIPSFFLQSSSQMPKSFFSYYNCTENHNVTWNLWTLSSTIINENVEKVYKQNNTDSSIILSDRVLIDATNDGIPDICQIIYYHLESKEFINNFSECIGKSYSSYPITDCDKNFVPDSVQTSTKNSNNRPFCSSPICSSSDYFYELPLECSYCKSSDLDENKIPDNCQRDYGSFVLEDCNHNGIDDKLEIVLNKNIDLDFDGKIDICYKDGQCWVDGICYNSTYSNCYKLKGESFVADGYCISKTVGSIVVIHNIQSENNETEIESTTPENNQTTGNLGNRTSEETPGTDNSENDKENSEKSENQNLGSCLIKEIKECMDDFSEITCKEKSGVFNSDKKCFELREQNVGSDSEGLNYNIDSFHHWSEDSESQNIFFAVISAILVFLLMVCVYTNVLGPYVRYYL